jgi:CheY-like chemotaxis protein
MLEQAGHTVTAATSEEELRAACERTSFDVVVIGQTVVPQEKQRIRDLIRQVCGDVKILELYQRHRGRALADADEWMEVPADIPYDFVTVVSELASRPVTQRRRENRA